MWYYVKTLEYPVNLKSTDIRMAKLLVSQYGGPDGELGAALRYLNQRYSMPTNKAKALLTDIGTEELEHLRYMYILFKDWYYYQFLFLYSIIFNSI